MSALELFGWLGTFAILFSYYLISFGKLTANSVAYQLLNIFGAIGIVVVSIGKSAWQPAVLNIVWAIIGGVALLRTKQSPE